MGWIVILSHRYITVEWFLIFGTCAVEKIINLVAESNTALSTKLKNIQPKKWSFRPNTA